IMGGKAIPRGGPGGPSIGITDREPRRKSDELKPDVLGERIEYNLVRLLDKTAELLRQHRREVLCLAHALETHKTLNGDDVVAVFERRRGPIIDGTIYDSDEFYQELEEYHAEAARAHREHSRVQRELPAVTREPVAAAVGNGGPVDPAVIVPPPGGPASASPAADGPPVITTAPIPVIEPPP